MDLLERYLQAVKKYLPWQRQADIIAELRANLEAQLEDKEASLGRPLTAGEAEDWLREIGPPMRIAARYQPQQHLIGPAVFPMYWYVLRMATLWGLGIYAVVCVVQIIVGAQGVTAIVEAMLRVPGILMTVAAWVTLVFAALEFVVMHYPDRCPAQFGFSADWSPASLPPLEKEADRTGKRNFAHAVGEVVFGFLFLAWLLLILHYPYLLLGPGAAYVHDSPFQLAPVWMQFYWWVVALNVLQLGWRCVSLMRGSWQQRRTFQLIVEKAFGLIPLVVLLSAYDRTWVMLKHPIQDEMRYGRALHSMNEGIHKALLIGCAIVILQLAWEVGRVSLEAYRKRVEATR